MKKLIIIASLITSLTSLSTFGQGYFYFATGKSQVWDCFSSASPQRATTVNVAFLWAPSGSMPMVDSIMTSTPTNGQAFFSASLAWNDILMDQNFTLAVNSANDQVAVAQSTTRGNLYYNNGYAFEVSGTSVATTYSVFMIGWDNAGGTLTTPTLAAAAGAAVGWGSPFSYTATAYTATPNSMMGVEPPFGVIGVPEPSTLALAGLGSLSLLLLRRRK
jgi:hypothetical protein